MYMEIKRRMPIGVELVKRGIVTENDIEKALEYQREHPNVKLGDILHIKCMWWWNFNKKYFRNHRRKRNFINIRNYEG